MCAFLATGLLYWSLIQISGGSKVCPEGFYMHLWCRMSASWGPRIGGPENFPQDGRLTVPNARRPASALFGGSSTPPSLIFICIE